MSLPSAIPIAFNRRLRAAWIQHGLHLRAEGIDGTEWVTQMKAMVSSETKGRDSIQKSLRYLRYALIEPGPVEALRAEAVELFSTSKDPEKSRVLSWGLATACYPFLNAVAAVIGRMVRIQSEFKLEQLLRKLTEAYGERETVRRSSRYSLGFIHDLGFVRRTKKAGCYQAGSSVTVGDPRLAGWFMKAWFFAEGIKDPIDRVALAGHPSLLAFDAPALIALALSQGVLVVERMSLSQDTLKLA